MDNKQKRVRMWLTPWLMLVGFGCGVASPYTFRPMMRCFPRYELKFAVAKGDIEGINHALDSGADINAHDGYVGRTPLMTAALHGQTQATQLLIARGAKVNVVDETGLTARDIALDQKHFDTAAVLAKP